MSDHFYRYRAHKDIESRKEHGVCSQQDCDKFGDHFCVYCNQRMCFEHSTDKLRDCTTAYEND